MRWLAPSLLCLAVAAGEPLTATPWDVRKDASELLDEIARSSGDAGDLLSRARTLILDHGHQLIATAGNEASPIADALTARLGSAGLGERFANELAPAAERKLSELLARSADAGAWANLARTLPGTPAAAKAWRRAADLAWDRGLIRLYQDAAIGAGDAADSVRSARLSAAAGMLISTPLTVPDSLDQLETMWQIGASQAPGPTAAPATAPARRRARVQPSLGRPGAAACGDGAITVANGQSLLVIDHLVGAPLGARIVLGNRALPAHVARPEPIAGGAVAVGLSEGRMVLVCADAAGSERWRFGGSIDSVEMVGAPVALDTLVVVPYRVLAEDRIEMRVLAVSARDGQMVWDTLIGQLLTTAWGGNGLAAPAVARHARGLVAFSNAGSYALLGGDGALRRMWSYPTRPELEIDGGRRGRRGLAASDGATVVATPADHAGLVLVLGPNDAAPRAYRGDGADGDVLAVQAGDALIAGRQVALVDTVRLRLRWAAPLRLSEAQGLLANATVLVAGNDQLALLARGNGTLRSSRATGQPATLAVGDGVLVLAEHETVRGFGDAKAFIDKLQQAAAAAGSDPRPHAALGAVLAGRGDTAGALAAWRTALGLGAGSAIAERMARLLRNRLALATTPGEMNAALDQLDQLSANLPGVADEIRLWRARIAESAGDKAAAASHFAAVLAGADRLLTLPDGLSISIRMLAEAGAARQGGSAWKPLTASDAPLPEAGTWSVPARISGRAVIGGSTVCAFADGLLRAWRLNDGSEAWRRKPQRALLGVQPWRDAAADGVAVQVMPGTAGAAAGLVDGDVLLSLNGEPLRDFNADLRTRVLALGGGAAFVFRVRNAAGVEREVRGQLGGEPLEPLASDGDILLARTTMALAPGRSDLRIFAIDAKTGADLWAHALSQDEERIARTTPLLASGIVVAADGPDLVGFERSGAVRWRLSGRAELLAQARVLGRCLWMPTTTSEAVLLEPRDGRELARIPAAADEAPALAASTLAVRRADGRVAVWDLANGRLIGRSTEPATAIALRSDGLLALDERRRPTVIDIASGGVRRVLAEAPVELTALGRDLAFVILAGAEHRSLIAFSLDGLVQRWVVELPPGIEVEALRPAAAGVLAILREGTRTWGLSLDERGQPLSFAGWVSESGGDATPLRHGALVVEAQALRVLRPGLPAPQPPLRCTVLDAAKPLREAAAAAKPAWSRPDGAAVAVARHGLLLVIAVRTADTEHVLRIGDGGSGTSLDAVRAMIAPGGLRLAIPGSWTLSEQWITAEASGPVIWSAWAPLPSRASGTPLAVLLNEHAGMPWWLSAGWQQVTDPP